MVVYCQAGIRSAKAAGFLSQLGYERYVYGSLPYWSSIDLPSFCHLGSKTIKVAGPITPPKPNHRRIALRLDIRTYQQVTYNTLWIKKVFMSACYRMYQGYSIVWSYKWQYHCHPLYVHMGVKTVYRLYSEALCSFKIMIRPFKTSFWDLEDRFPHINWQ
jgi:hypothetical protein